MLSASGVGRPGASRCSRAAGSCSRPTRARRSWPAGCPPSSVVSLGAGPVPRRRRRRSSALRERGHRADPVRGRPARLRLAARGRARRRALPHGVAAPRPAGSAATSGSRSSRSADLLPGGPPQLRAARRPPRRRPPLPALRAQAELTIRVPVALNEATARSPSVEAELLPRRLGHLGGDRPDLHADAVADVDDRADLVLDHVHAPSRARARARPRPPTGRRRRRPGLGPRRSSRRGGRSSRSITVSPSSPGLRDAADHVRAGERRDEDVGRARDELLRRAVLAEPPVDDHADVVGERRRRPRSRG